MTARRRGMRHRELRRGADGQVCEDVGQTVGERRSDRRRTPQADGRPGANSVADDREGLPGRPDAGPGRTGAARAGARRRRAAGIGGPAASAAPAGHSPAPAECPAGPARARPAHGEARSWPRPSQRRPRHPTAGSDPVPATDPADGLTQPEAAGECRSGKGKSCCGRLPRKGEHRRCGRTSATTAAAQRPPPAARSRTAFTRVEGSTPSRRSAWTWTRPATPSSAST